MFDAAQDKLRAAKRKLTANKKPEYPSKTTINLAHVEVERSMSATSRAVLLGLVALLLLVFLKFGVFDLISEANEVTDQAADLQAQLAELEESNADYQKIKAQLEKYSAPGMTAEEETFANRAHALAVADAVSGLGKQLESVSLTGNTLQIKLVDTNLSTVSDVVSKIKKVKWVTSVLPNTAANTEESQNITAAITVELVPSPSSSAASDATDTSDALSDSVQAVSDDVSSIVASGKSSQSVIQEGE
ncbi:MAG: hypothetical protein Q4F23_01330 [Coriobacteriia bacterium]|nr:hypothetical protein [Coriobacteriia bacterium]